MLLMCDRSPTMSRGDSGPDGEEPALPLSTAAGGGGQMGPSGDLGGRAQIEHLGGGERGALREGGQEDEEMTNVSHDLSSSSNQSPESATGSTSSFIKREHAGGGRGQARRDMMDTVAEMKRRLPSDRRSRNKASTVDALNYALNCVKQVQANSEYYKLLMQNGQDQRKDATVCTLEELERVTSEHNLKNTDSFVMVFSLSSGRVLYASEQAPSLLCCKRKYLESAKFVELLFHQDVNVFYSHTAQPHLPPWSNSHSAGVLFDSAQVKSFFCRIRGSKDRDGEMRYNPFRITPYLLKVQGTESGEEEEPCCLALAERIISGYEAPRIPMDKRIFTTTHSPGCIFLEVDDRAVPLLGYLPQDLIGTSLLTCIHPEDFPLMLSMHRKVLKYAGQPPFEHSPVRLRCQNGDYVTLDTSWSSFINPWSRKVAFIIGRHKVRTSPLNEDVLAALNRTEVPVSHEEIKDLQAKIYKLFLQPVHNNGSSGYGSLGSNGSHEHYISFASSSDSNGNLWEDSHREPMTLQQICADVNRAKTWGRQGCLNSCQKRAPHGKPSTAPHPLSASNAESRGSEGSRKQTHIPSYQQINCVDNIVRYLESCAGQVLKRKNESHSLTTSSSSSSTSEEEKPAGGTDVARSSSDVVLLDSEVSVGPAVVGAPLTDITMSSKAMSVVSVTSQCSYSSTIVHVPQPDSEATAPEDAPMGSEPADVTATPVRLAPSPATEDRRFVGLTKEVLSAHTQKEEQEYIDRFRHRILQSPYSSYLQLENDSMAHSHHPGDYLRPLSAGGWNRTRRGKLRHKRPKPQGSSDSYASPAGPLYCVPDSSWPSSESSQPHMAQTHCQTSPLQGTFFSVTGKSSTEQLPRLQQMPAATPAQLQPSDHLSYNFNIMQLGQSQPGMPPVHMEPLQNVQNFYSPHPMASAQSFNPYMAPVMAVIMPNYPTFTPGFPSVYLPSMSSVAPQPPNIMTSFAPGSASHVQPQSPAQPGPHTSPGLPLISQRASSVGEEEEAAEPRALFSSSRSSSPLQLNLLQEELPRLSEGQSSTGHNHSESLHEQLANKGEAPSESSSNDAQLTSSELLDLLLQEDARSGTGSNASGSGSGESGGSLGSGSGSNGTSTSHTGSSKYFASNDSSDTSRKARKSQEAPVEHQHSFDARGENSMWSMIQHTPDHVMMTYQMHPRDQSEVLAEDREKLRVLQPLQPWFTQEQREELAQVHPWIKQHTIPQEIDTEGCMSCCSGAAMAHPPQLPVLDSSSPVETLQQDSVGSIAHT
ncbi:period circadian protein homolog 3 isoform X1 [Nothobranchius furzeri]|uniref:Period circadian regulator 3 n=1 Tax=Nothobranchius furzeri TaxID=105023 RepID=A0A1A8A702_NOTFU|nr:transcript variant X1 [Nothobranchius furzeri]